jgi:hypothetical protein
MKTITHSDLSSVGDQVSEQVSILMWEQFWEQVSEQVRRKLAIRGSIQIDNQLISLVWAQLISDENNNPR